MAIVVARMPSYRLQWSWILVLFLGPCIVASEFSSNNSLRRRIQVAVDQETVFVDECTSFLLSDDALDDGLISQDEFASFLSGYCISLGLCSTGTELDFQNLSVELQLSFLLFICDQPQDLEREQCLDSLVNEGGEFGYDLSVNELAVVEMEVEQLCSQAFQYASLTGLLPPPTIAPTTAPSVATTVSPTLFPTPNDGSLGSPPPTNGSQPDGPTDGENDDPFVSDSSGLSTPAIAGVSVAAAVVVVVAAALLFHRRRGSAVDNNEKDFVEYEVAGDASIFTEDSAQFKLGLPQSLQGSIRGGGSISGSSAMGSSGSDYTPKNSMLGTGKSRSVAQFDPSNAAAAIALGISGAVLATSSSRGVSVRSIDSETKEAKIRDLDEAINSGDWEKVAALAGSLASSSEEVSSWSEMSSNAGPATSVRSSLSSLRSEEVRLAAQIDDLVRRGDWSGVAAAAENFSSTASGRNVANDGVADASGEQPKRSFLDFVTGRRILSSAADAAIVPISQDRSDNTESQHAIVGGTTTAVFDFGNGQSSTFETESSSSHGSKKGKRGNRKSSKGFLGRFWSGRTASEGSFAPSSQPVAAAASLPRSPSDDGDEGGKKPAAISSTAVLRAKLEEALDRGDWGAIEAISAEIDALSADSSKQKGGMSRSAVIKQFISKGSSADDDPILGTASLSSSKNSATRLREVSTPSRRVELDNAVERGDWESVERLTTELINSDPTSQRDGSFKILTDDDKLTDTLLMDSAALSPIVSSPSKSPFRETPSSCEWSQSPIDREKTDAIQKLINAQDWQSVHVLSGIFEMEKNGTLPPTFASMSADSAESPMFSQKWLRPGPTGTPPDVEQKVGPGRPPPSPSTSSSTEASVDLKEFQRLVNEKDWQGLASFAGAEEEGDFGNEALFARNLFDGDSENEPLEVELRQAGGPTPIIKKSESDQESIHGAELLIPFWEQVISQHSPDASKADASKMSDRKGNK